MENNLWERQTSYHIHAGSKNEWTPKYALVFRSKTHAGDYHDEMNGEHFLDWFDNKLLQKFPGKSLIILDNTLYRNVVLGKVPTKSSTKTVMKE